MVTSESKRLRESIQRFFYGLMVITTLLIILGIFFRGWEKFAESLLSITGGELIVGLGTIFLALFTAALVLSSSEDASKSRALTLEENRKFRRKEHLLKQLNFYSELKGELIGFTLDGIFIDNFLRFQNSMDKIQTQWKYELWSENKLNSLFKSYFGGLKVDFYTLYQRNLLDDEKRKLFEQQTKEVFNKILYQIDVDFDKLKEEYLS